jgi:signal transduction histidine kinase/CheY-like chemotaxis protein
MHLQAAGAGMSSASTATKALGGMTATRLALLRAIRSGDLAEARRVLASHGADDLGDPIDALVETVGIYQEELRLQSEELQLSRARAEETGARLQRVFEQLPVPALLLDRGGVIIDANQAALRRFALDLRAQRMHLLRRHVAPEATHRIGEALAEAKLLGQSFLAELALTLPDGRPGVADLYVTRLEPDGSNSREEFLCALIDHTAQHELSDRFDLAVRAGGVGVWDYDVPTRRARLSETMQAHLGLDADEVPLEDWFACVHPEDTRRARDDLARAMVHTNPYESEFRVHQPDGTERILHCLGAVQRNAEGRPLRAYGVSYDVTAQRNADEQQRARELAERANQAKNEFLSRMIHELRTPLNAILGFAQLMDAGVEPLSIKHKAHVKQVEAAGWHLVQLVNDLLDLSRIESGQTELKLEPVDLADAVHAAAQLARSAVAIHRDIEIKFDLDHQFEPQVDQQNAAPGPSLRVQADATRLKQVLVNLISNAIKYNRDHGQVEVTVSAESPWASVAVRDTGPGIPQAQVARMFEPFNRLGVSTEIEGTGLGLSIARRLTELMRGQLAVASTEGVGSTFTLRLPLAAALAPPEPPGSSAAPTFDVLYVEDNIANAELMREVLALRPGCRLRLAHGVADALAQLRLQSADLLLVDLNLSGESGLDLMEHLRANTHAHGGTLPPWIAVTADVMPATELAVQAAGAMALWHKPIDVSEVLAKIDVQRQTMQERRVSA